MPNLPASVSVGQMRAVLAGPAEQAIAWLQEAAGRGFPEAQTALGQRLLEGHGVGRDPGRAVYWFKKAAHVGFPMGMNMVGRCYENGWGIRSAPLMAAYWYRLAALANLDWGMYNYATQLMLGTGVDANRAEAFAWFRKAADRGHAKAINIVGGFYEDGWEVPMDRAAAAECYRRAAEAGDFRGQFNHARMLAEQGRAGDASQWLAASVNGATPAFRARLCEFLRRSDIPEFHAFGSELGAPVETGCPLRAADQ